MTLIEALKQLEPHLDGIQYDASISGYWVGNRQHFFSADVKGHWRSEFVVTLIEDAIASHGWSLTEQMHYGKWSAMISGDGIDLLVNELEYETKWEALTHEFLLVMQAIKKQVQKDEQN